MTNQYQVRQAASHEFEQIGELLVGVYSKLNGFPSPQEQPDYYAMLARVGNLTQTESIELLVASTPSDLIHGAVVFIGDMKDYGAGGAASKVENACGFRLLAVSSEARGQGVGKLLSQACIDRARSLGKRELIIHSTKAMSVAWSMYEHLGFERSTELDFLQQSLKVYGFRYQFDESN